MINHITDIISGHLIDYLIIYSVIYLHIYSVVVVCGLKYHTYTSHCSSTIDRKRSSPH